MMRKMFLDQLADFAFDIGQRKTRRRRRGWFMFPGPAILRIKAEFSAQRLAAVHQYAGDTSNMTIKRVHAPGHLIFLTCVKLFRSR